MQSTSLKTDDGLTLSALVDGPESGPLVVLIHGFPDTPHSWLPLAGELTRQGYRVLIPWLRGYTPDSCRRDCEYGVMPAVRDLSAWMQSLGNPEAHLVGHDWGATIATTHSNAEAHRWKSVASLAIPLFCAFARRPLKIIGQMPAQMKASSYMLEMQKVDSALMLAASDCQRIRTLWSEWSPDFVLSEAQFDDLRQVFSNTDLGWAATRYYRGLFTPLSSDTRAVFKHQFQEPVVPTLVLAGENDGCMVQGFQKAMFEAVSDNPMIVSRLLKDCGHFLQLEKPQEVAEQLMGHWARAELLDAA